MNFITRRKRPKMGLRESAVIRCPGHLKWIRGCLCIVSDPICAGRMVAAHVRIGTDGGTSMKPGDNFANPMCDGHHTQQHQIGEPAFERQYKIDLKASALKHWTASPHGARYRRDHS